MAWCNQTGSPAAGTSPNQRRVARRSSARPITRRAIGLMPWKSYRSQASRSRVLRVDWMPATSSMGDNLSQVARARPWRESARRVTTGLSMTALISGLAGVADAVAVRICLARVGRVGTVVAGVAAAVVITIGLVRVGEPRTVVVDVEDGVDVGVEGLRRAAGRGQDHRSRAPLTTAVDPCDEVIER